MILIRPGQAIVSTLQWTVELACNDHRSSSAHEHEPPDQVGAFNERAVDFRLNNVLNMTYLALNGSFFNTERMVDQYMREAYFC